MKKLRIPRLRLLGLLFLCSISMSNAHAQTTLTPANNGDRVSSLNAGIPNCAVIDASNAGIGQLKVIVAEAGSSGITYLMVDDGVNSPNVLSFTGTGADVVIGNKLMSTDFLVGVVYAKTIQNPCGPLYDIWLDIYDVVNVGTGSFAVNYNNSYLISKVAETQTCNGRPRIDIVADYYNVASPPALPICDEFVIAWIDPSVNLPSAPCNVGGPNADFGLNLYYASLNAPTGSPVYLKDVSYLSSINLPVTCDVAAVQIDNAGPEIVAYYTYTDAANNLYENWTNMTTTAPGTANILGGNMDGTPKIDAIDNYSYNDYSTSNNVWMVVDNDLSSPNVAIGFPGYSNTSGSFTMGGWSSPLNDMFPAVTFGPGLNYTVAYDHVDGFDSYASSTPLPYNTTMTAPTAYYCINYNGIPNIVPNALSSTCNNDGTIAGAAAPELFACWNDATYVNYKGSPDVYNWKHAHTVSVPLSKGMNQWTVSPNPGRNHVLLSTTGNLQDGSYNICDISGRELLKASINGNKTIADISKLANGLYMVHIYEGLNEIKTMKFVKE